jgi:Holliday junction resolvase RusA-like endonuclease
MVVVFFSSSGKRKKFRRFNHWYLKKERNCSMYDEEVAKLSKKEIEETEKEMNVKINIKL